MKLFSTSITGFCPMNSLVFSIRHYRQIRNIIIKFIPINMMNMFGRKQGSTDVAFHYMTMFKHLFAIYCYKPIAIKIKASFSIRPAFSYIGITVHSFPVVVFSAKRFAPRFIVTPFDRTWRVTRKLILRHIMLTTKSFTNLISFTGRVGAGSHILMLPHFTLTLQ